MFKTISTNHTLLIEIEELPIVPIPMILPDWLPPNFTFPHSFIVRVRNIDFLLSYVLSNRCLGTMIFAFPLLLGISAVLTISDLGTHCFMGPLRLVLEVLLFTSCTLCNSPIFSRFNFNCLGVINYAYMWLNCLCVYFNRISELEGYFDHFVSKGKLVIMMRTIFSVSTENYYF